MTEGLVFQSWFCFVESLASRNTSAGIATPMINYTFINLSTDAKLCPHLEREKLLSMTLGVSSLHHNAATVSRALFVATNVF